MFSNGNGTFVDVSDKYLDLLCFVYEVRYDESLFVTCDSDSAQL